jgi:2-polyprenyl-6-methoxyphenol hydroxylase-like FAD-dependent oxidoreductase
MLRGDIEAALWRGMSGDGTGIADVEVRFATVPVEIVDGATDVQVLLENLGTGEQYRESFALVVGADGLRSSVRRLVFGPHEEFLTTWNAMICAFQLQEQVPSFGATDSVVSARAGRAVWVFGLADRAPTVLLTYRTDDIEAQFTGPRVERLRAVFAGMDDPVVRYALDALERAPDHLFDSVHQVKMPRWSTRRVVLVGDSAWCLTTFTGMGASASLRGGAALGAALRGHPDDLDAALDAYETGLRPFITAEQRKARVKQQRFVPSNRVTEVLRAGVLELIRKVVHRRLDAEATVPPAQALSSTTR